MLLKDFWIDWRIQELAKANRTDEISVILYSNLGILPCRDQNITGIYLIHRENFETFYGLPLDRSTAALEYVTKEYPSILEYDVTTHMLFIKEFFAGQTDYKPGIKSIPDIMKGFRETYSKMPRYWHEFSQENGECFKGLILKIAEASDKCFIGKVPSRQEQVDFVEKLINLKDLPSPSINPEKLAKLLLENPSLKTI